MAIPSAGRAADAWKRIQDKPTSVAFRTPAGVTLAAQTVRLEWDNRATLLSSVAGVAPRMQLIVFGIRGHATLADSDIREGYTFNYNNDSYRIGDIILQIGEIQGIATATG